ncbi:hypothetical protein G9C85_18285 [Halorubellus sp. JP-L1]|uniref:DUF7289 family protein n=1 Tax=Halorubellus sp. JP-L1 TaxID=2715753 RepID=UPI0014082D23|nr:hypothetical protein [Halorubellus sp. JP-L1]NHN43571.1 hypothetical protein [Halorubellus sp. JP-L1]
MSPVGAARGRSQARGVAPVVGLVLLVGLVVAGSGILFVAGMDAKRSMQDASAIEDAETSLQSAGATFQSLSHTGSGSSASVTLADGRERDVAVVNDGTLRVQLNGKPACTAETELGTVVAEHDSGTTVAYQAGAVFKQSPSGTTVVQTPALDYRTESMNGHPIRTVSFPVTNVTGDVDGSGDAVATAEGPPGDGIQDDLCLTDAGAGDLEYVREVTITVEGSEYYEAWHRYFQEEFGTVADYSVDHGTQTASVTAPLGAGVRPNQFAIEDVRIYGGIFSTAASGDLLLQTKHASIDSYDATNGPWATGEPTYGDDGEVFTRGSVAVQASGASVAGDVYAEGTVSLSESCGTGGEYCVIGDVVVNNSTPSGPTTSLQPGDDDERAERIGGTWDNGTSLPSVPKLDATIDRTVAAADEYNTNDDAAAVSGDGIQYAGGSATLESGVYHLSDLTVPAGKTLELDTTDGDVVLAVEDDVSIESDATVTVTGDGRVQTFVADSTGADDQLTVGEGATVEVVDGGVRTYRSNGFVIACKAGCSATFADAPSSNPTTFTGVLYGPGDESDDGTVSLGKRVDVWGALVAGSVTFEQQAEFHFDRSLQNHVADSDGDGAPDAEATGALTHVDPGVQNGYVVSVTTRDVNVSSDTPRLAASDAIGSAAGDGPRPRVAAFQSFATARERPAVRVGDGE